MDSIGIDERTVRQIIASEMMTLETRFTQTWGEKVRALDSDLNSEDENHPGLKMQVRELRASAAENRMTTRWIIVMLALIFIAVLICLAFLVLLWIQVSVLSVKVTSLTEGLQWVSAIACLFWM